MKVVICTVPMRAPNEVKPVVYRADGNKAVEYDKPVRSPINAVLAKTLKKGEELRVIFIMTTGKNSHCEENKAIIIKELEDINAGIGAVLNNDTYITVDMEFSATKQTYNKLITDLTEKIPEDAELYVDITYGSKPEIISLFCALGFVEEFHDAIVEYFIYGKAEFNRETREIEDPVIFDITSLYYLFKLIGSMGGTKPEKAKNTLKDFFAL
jgi:hypothetical protein